MRCWISFAVYRRAWRIALAAGLAGPGAAPGQTPPPDDAWLGAGVRSRPAYDGSATQRAEIIPAARYYGKPWFARTTQGLLEGGVRKEVAPGLNLGAQLAYEGGRAMSESAFLREHGVPDVSPGASVGLHIEWDHRLGPMPVTLLARGRQNVDRDRGAQADLRLTGVFFGGGALTLAVFAQGTWASGKSAATFYGVTSASTGLATYEAGSGPLFAAVGLLGGYDLGPRWVLLFGVEGRRLQGDAAASPLTERRSSAYASLSAGYKF